jgi:5-methylcytosine-specific restriction endonuclease McrA
MASRNKQKSTNKKDGKKSDSAKKRELPKRLDDPVVHPPVKSVPIEDIPGAETLECKLAYFCVWRGADGSVHQEVFPLDIEAIKQLTGGKTFTRSLTETSEKKAKSPRKKADRKQLPSKIRHQVWRKYNKGSMDGSCWCCADPISIENWHAGHVIPAVKGGRDIVDNLRPLCSQCNLSMGKKPMNEFMCQYDMKGRGRKEFNLSEEKKDEDLTASESESESVAEYHTKRRVKITKKKGEVIYAECESE